MHELNHQQRDRALRAMHDYLNGAPGADGQTLVQAGAQLDSERRVLIETELRPLLMGYLSGAVPLLEFKSTIDGFNKRHEHWGFKGIKGMLLFNLMTNVAGEEGEAELDAELKAALVAPTSEDMAKSRINTFISYIKRLGEDHLERGGSKPGRPQPGSAPFFLTYFWQIQEPAVWPVFYTNSVKTMTDLNLWQPSEDWAADYIRFKHIHEELASLFTQASGREFGLYDVEHVFWSGNEARTTATAPATIIDAGSVSPTPTAAPPTGLPDSYVPPLVAVLPRLARHEPQLVAAAKASGTSIERAFEKYIEAAFTMLGYDSRLLGQGLGRVPDGLAIDEDNSYALIWDAKVRAGGYSIGTDDRTIREYITTISREQKRKRTRRNIYYVIISSSFADGGDDTIRAIKMETDVNEVVLMEADALVAMVEQKLRDPRNLSLGPDGLQRLFSSSGVLTSQLVQELLG